MADQPTGDPPKPPAAIVDPHTAGRWYVVQSKRNAELLATHRLNAEGFAVFWPHYLGTVSHARRKIGVMRALYPRYLFVAVDDRHGLYTVEKTIGVSAVVYLGATALTIPASVIRDQMARTDERGTVRREVAEALGLVEPERRRHEHRYAPGQAVRFAAGPFRDFVGIVERLDKNDSLRVCVELFGRLTSVEAVESDLAAASLDEATASP